MKKYWHVIRIGIQNQLVYRANFFFRAAFGLLPLMATISLWRTVYAGKGPDALVGDYTLAQMVSYYLLVTLVDAFTQVAEDDWQIAADIKDGNISQFMLKPIDYLYYRLCLYFSGRLIYTTVAAIPVISFILWMRAYFVAPASLAAGALFMWSVFMASLLQFFLAYLAALLAFWVLEVATFIFINYAFEYVASGHLFPLDILPPWIAALLNLTPFPYMLYFPVSIYLGRIEGEALALGLVTQAAWVVVVYALARLVWSRGIRHYAAVGG